MRNERTDMPPLIPERDCIPPLSHSQLNISSIDRSKAHQQPSAAAATDSAALRENSQVHTRPSHTARAATPGSQAAAAAAGFAVASIAGVALVVEAEFVEEEPVVVEASDSDLASSVPDPASGMEGSAMHRLVGLVVTRVFVVVEVAAVMRSFVRVA